MKSTSFPTLSKQKKIPWILVQMRILTSHLTSSKDDFVAFLKAAGAEILDQTNEWEYLRFRSQHGVSIIYFRKNGAITYTGVAEKATQAFFYKTHWSALTPTKRRTTPPTDVELLLKRDGDCCMLCGHLLNEDRTIEHWVALSHSGPDNLANKALMHEKCNQRLGNLSLSEKIKLRDKVRAKEEADEAHSYSRYLDSSPGTDSVRS